MSTDWHEAARQMKREGASIADIAAKFDRCPNAVQYATKGVPSRNGTQNRKPSKKGAAAGFKLGKLLRVMVSFTPEQIDRVNAVVARENISFSKAVSGLVDARPLETKPAAFEVLDHVNGAYVTTNEQAALATEFPYNGLYRRVGVKV